jgi:MFS transporter, ACS family, glucarate transporter
VTAAPPPAAPARPQRLRVRWKIFAFLFGFGLIAYLQQRSLSVAAYRMMPELGISQMQIGWLESALLLGYTFLQLPGGVLGQRLGARATFVLIGLVAFAATLATPLAPLALGGTLLFAALLAAQFVLGAAQAPIFPVSAGVFETWFVPLQWPLVQGVQSLGLGIGAALAPPLIAWLMSFFGWQRALIWTALPALALIGGWAWYGRNTPAEHRAVGAAELAELGAHARAEVDAAISWRRLWLLLRDRDLAVLTVSYVCMNYTFYLLANWCFLYLVQERHVTVLESGWLAGMPPLAAGLGAGIGGKLASVFAARYGTRRGLRLVPLVSLPAAGLLLLAAMNAGSAYLAVIALALSFGSIELNEGPYWAAGMHLGGADTMAATGLMNTGGNLGGLIATPIVAYLSAAHQWTAAFILGTGFAMTSAALWLLVDPTRGLAGEEPERSARPAAAS